MGPKDTIARSQCIHTAHQQQSCAQPVSPVSTGSMLGRSMVVVTGPLFSPCGRVVTEHSKRGQGVISSARAKTMYYQQL